ncbi:MOSC domain-containing protein YiiM [Metabacillus crassostreae]|uniref:MOSC domain-containing protein n=1 Tax=Metabacillus crassostreae TaxID=929098 RepID=UPI00195AD0B5|nr:MOSC domain-containing protein [Metabacillus crassostreae]MBM7606398.1 MOSC domain-containing protein YiiM [Metabacillus crassostreae]
MAFQLVWLSKGKPTTLTFKGKEFRSGISKNQVDYLEVTNNGIIGDDVQNHEFHGGSERVICVYPYEHYAFWKNMYQTPLTQAAFGENLTLTGMKETDIHIGDIIEIGDTILQVSQGRFPCSTINKYTNINTLLNKIVEHGYTGYFFRVLQEGKIESNSKINIIEKHHKKISVASIHHTYFHNKKDMKQIEKILSLEELSLEWKERFEKLHLQQTKK